MKPVLRLIADDLTGALDTAGELAGLCGAVRVGWASGEAGRSVAPPPQPCPAAAGEEAGRASVPSLALAGEGGRDSGRVGPALATESLALDSATREATRDDALMILRGLAPALHGADIAFKKIDSLLRGHVAAELVACLAGGPFTHCILAPAFPAQGRITRGGRVLRRAADGGFAPVPVDLPAALAAEALGFRRATPDTPPLPGVTLYDAETDADLERIAAMGRALPGPVLWCGSGGLARALAGPDAVVPDTALAGPVLGIFGSDQAVTARQLAACGPAWLRLGDDPSPALRALDDGLALVSFDLPALDRAAAARDIAARIAALVQAIPRPATLLAAGGETLRAICTALGAEGLDATGMVSPGVPRSTLRGGAWDGVAVISKSGAFGGDALWRDLLAENGLLEGTPA